MIIPRHRRHNGFAIVVICQQSYSTILVIIKKEPTTMSGLLIGYRLCVLASGTTDNRIFMLSTSIKHSCLHFGQNMGKFFNEVSARIFVRVLHLQKGQCIHPLSSTQNSSVFCISFAPSFLFSVIFFPAIPIKSAQLIDIIFCFLHRHIVNDYFKYTRIKSTGNNV